MRTAPAARICPAPVLLQRHRRRPSHLQHAAPRGWHAQTPRRAPPAPLPPAAGAAAGCRRRWRAPAPPRCNNKGVDWVKHTHAAYVRASAAHSARSSTCLGSHTAACAAPAAAATRACSDSSWSAAARRRGCSCISLSSAATAAGRKVPCSTRQPAGRVRRSALLGGLVMLECAAHSLQGVMCRCITHLGRVDAPPQA